ncbi:MAG: DUF397 domain-containing protein [Actinophytocola sp.]|nr:DUF397 domain-containing protein [Actinophytocola sp.]
MVDFSDARWRKASASDAQGACVEVAFKDGRYGMRDSKDPAGPVLRFTPGEWSAFVTGVRAGEFD